MTVIVVAMRSGLRVAVAFVVVVAFVAVAVEGWNLYAPEIPPQEVSLGAPRPPSCEEIRLNLKQI